jgi:hypothetical protein
MLILNPAWPHFLGIFFLGFACFVGIFNLFINGHYFSSPHPITINSRAAFFSRLERPYVL